jgi:VanZ family protein
MGVIFYFSSQPGYGHPVKNWQFYVERKGAHIFEYFILTVLFLRIFLAQEIRGGMKRERGLRYLMAVIFSFIYAASDEFHQAFVFGREGKITDIGIDIVGISLGLSVYSFSVFLFIKKKNGKRESGRIA